MLSNLLQSLRFRLLLAMSIVVLVAIGAVAVFTSRSTMAEFQRYVQNDIENNQRIVGEMLAQYRRDSSPQAMQSLVDRLAQTSGQRVVVANGTGKIIADSGRTMVGEMLSMPEPFPAQVGPMSQGSIMLNQGGMPVKGVITQPLTTGLSSPGAGATVDNIFTVPVTNTMTVSWSPIFVPLGMMAITSTGSIAGTQSMEPVPPSKGSYVTTRAGEGPGDGAGAGADLIIARMPDPGGTPIQEGFLKSVNQQLLVAVIAAGALTLLITWLLSTRIVGPVEALTAAAGRMERGDLNARVQVRSGDEIGKLAHAFNAMSDSLARQEQLRRDMVADVAHELRTPISNIRGYLEAARDGIVEPDPTLIKSLHEESLLLSRLVEDLQELQLAEAGQMRLESAPLSITEIMESTATGMRPTAYARGVNLKSEAPADLPPVLADRERLGQILRNLVDNALRHTPSGGRVSLAARAAGNEVEITVTDTGTGIAPEQLPRIFDRFYRPDGSRSRTTGGAGLGLAIVKQLVSLQGGRVWATSTPGQGATFGFTLPVAVKAEQSEAVGLYSESCVN